MNASVVDSLIQAFPHLSFLQNVTLAPYTYMKVGGPAQLFIEVTLTDDLFDLSAFCFLHAIPFVVLGGVSNTVISDEGIQKLVILNKTNEVEIRKSDGSEKATVVADSGVITAMLANETMKADLTGLEYFVGVPGTIGGAVVNNSHFTLHELIGNCILSVEVCTEEGTRAVWMKENLQFGYDYSIFHTTKAVILKATFELYKGDQVHIKEKMMQAAQKRVRTQPIGIPSTGCMFKNPKISTQQLASLQGILSVPESAVKSLQDVTQIAAGFLIDQAGMKNTVVGGAQVSDKHATYIVNLGSATAKDIDELANEVESNVFKKFGIKLEREVFFLH